MTDKTEIKLWLAAACRACRAETDPAKRERLGEVVIELARRLVNTH